MARKRNRGRLAQKVRGAMKRTRGRSQKVNVIRGGSSGSPGGMSRSARSRYGKAKRRR